MFVIGAFIFAFLGSRPLSNPDEGRYSEIPREMALSSDYVTPRLDGVKYFEKPPLVYWLSAITFRAFGISEWSARLWCAAFAVFGAVLTYAAGRALYNRETGLWSAAVLSLSLLYYALSRIVLLDLVVSVFMAGALFAFLVAVRLPVGARRRALFSAFYAAMALATLTKGLIGFVLPCMIIFLWLLALNEWQRLRPFYPVSGGIIFLLIATPWHLAAVRANGDFAYFYFVHEHLLRFTTQTHGRIQPWWFFLPVVAGGLFPSIVFFGQAAKQSFPGGWGGRHENREAWFLLIWFIAIIGFFSISQSKLVPYIAPVLPAAAVVIGRYLDVVWRGGGKRGARIGLLVFASLAAALVLVLVFAPLPSNYYHLTASLRPGRFVLAGILGCGAIAVGICAMQRVLRAALIAMALSCALFFASLNFVAGTLDNRSTKPLALALQARLAPDDAVFSVGEYFQDLPVYLNRLVDVVDYEGELSFGIHSEPMRIGGRFIAKAAFLSRWHQTGTAYAVVQKDKLSNWFSGADMLQTVVAETPHAILLVNRPVVPNRLATSNPPPRPR